MNSDKYVGMSNNNVCDKFLAAGRMPSHPRTLREKSKSVPTCIRLRMNVREQKLQEGYSGRANRSQNPIRRPKQEELRRNVEFSVAQLKTSYPFKIAKFWRE